MVSICHLSNYAVYFISFRNVKSYLEECLQHIPLNKIVLFGLGDEKELKKNIKKNLGIESFLIINQDSNDSVLENFQELLQNVQNVKEKRTFKDYIAAKVKHFFTYTYRVFCMIEI